MSVIIIDIFIARKRNLENENFGLVRFKCLEYLRTFEVNLNIIFVGVFQDHSKPCKIPKKNGKTYGNFNNLVQNLMLKSMEQIKEHNVPKIFHIRR